MALNEKDLSKTDTMVLREILVASMDIKKTNKKQNNKHSHKVQDTMPHLCWWGKEVSSSQGITDKKQELWLLNICQC